MTKVFISYSRKDKVFAGRLTEALQKSELETWIDWEDIPPTADWMDQIHKGIEEADAFLFLLSPDSVASKVCGQEVDHAVQNGKRLIPIVARDVNPNDVHPALGKVNWIYCREADDFDGAINKTLSAIRTDLAWVEAHKRLQVRAIEWERKNKENSFLLRGKDLQDAEQQLSLHATTNPQPTDLQREYTLKSRQVADRQRRLVTIVSIVAAFIMLGLAIFGFNRAVEATKQKNTAQTAEANAENQRATAVANANIALSRQLAAQANNVLSEKPDLALLLSVEGYKSADTNEIRDILLKSLLHKPKLITTIDTEAPVTSIIFSQDGKYVAAGFENGSVILWKDFFKSEQIISIRNDAGMVKGLSFNPGSNDVIVLRCKEGEYGSRYGLICQFTITNMETQATKKLSASGAVWPAAAISPDGSLLAFNTTTGLQLWDVKNDRPLGSSFVIQHGADIYSLAFSPDNHWLIVGECSANSDTGCFDGIIEGWDISKANLAIQSLPEILGHQGNAIVSLAFDLDGKILATGSCIHLETLLGNCPGGEVNIWNVDNSTNGQLSLQKIGASEFTQSGPVSSLAVNRANKNIFESRLGTVSVNAGDERVYLYSEPSFSTGEPWSGISFVGSTSSITSLTISPDGRWLIVASIKSIRIWELNPEPAIKSALDAGSSGIRSLTFISPNQITGTDNFGNFWNMDLSTSSSSFTNSSALGISITAPNGVPMALVSLDDGETMQLMDLTTDQPMSPPLVGFEGWGNMAGLATGALAISPDRNILAATSENQTILWDLTSMNYEQKLSPIILDDKAGGISIAFSPDEKYLATGGMKDGVKIWDLKTHSIVLRIFSGAATPFTALAFMPDGRLIAAADCETYLLTDEAGAFCQGSEVRLWDLVTNQSFGAPLSAGTDFIIGLAFDQSGEKLIATSMYDMNMIMWDFKTDHWAQFACTAAGRNLTYIEWEQYFPDRSYPNTQENATCSQ
jgi:WD40 repeat protein